MIDRGLRVQGTVAYYGLYKERNSHPWLTEELLHNMDDIRRETLLSHIKTTTSLSG